MVSQKRKKVNLNINELVVRRFVFSKQLLPKKKKKLSTDWMLLFFSLKNPILWTFVAHRTFKKNSSLTVRAMVV